MIISLLLLALDRVYSINAALFWKAKHAALTVIRRAMRAGGLITTTHQPRRPGATEADTMAFADALKEAMRGSGFGAIRNEILPLLPVPAVCVLGEAV